MTRPLEDFGPPDPFYQRLAEQRASDLLPLLVQRHGEEQIRRVNYENAMRKDYYAERQRKNAEMEPYLARIFGAGIILGGVAAATTKWPEATQAIIDAGQSIVSFMLPYNISP